MRKYKKFVVGFDIDEDVIYGEEESTQPVGIKLAKKIQKEIIDWKGDRNEKCNVIIYELLPVVCKK